MARTLFIEDSVAGARCLLINEGVPWLFDFVSFDASKSALNSPEPKPGDVCVGIVRAVNQGRGAFIDIGASRDGFLPFRKNMARPTEGERLLVSVRREALGEKGAVLSTDWRKHGVYHDPSEVKPTGKPRILSGFDDPLANLFRAPTNRSVDDIIVATADIAARLKALRGVINARITIDANAVSDVAMEEHLDGALDQTVQLSNGARLIFDETEGGVVVDVDSVGVKESDAVNIAAVRALPGEFSRRGLGGRVIVDFLPPSSAKAKRLLLTEVTKEMRRLADCHIGQLRADGLFDATIKRTRKSLLQQATESVRSKSDLRPARRLLLDFVVQNLFFELERRLRATRRAHFTIRLAPAISSYIEVNQWQNALAQRHGPRVRFDVEPLFEARHYDIAENP